MSRIQQVVNATPITTLSLIIVNTVVFIVEFLFDVPQQRVVMSPVQVISNFEIWRLVTSALSHAGIFHILMNMMTLAAIGKLVEQKLGSLRFAILILYSIAAVGLLHVALSYIIYIITQNNSWIYQGSLGFSGVLFHLMVIECHLLIHQNVASRDLFGMIHIPSWLYPWVILVILQLILPNLSLLGHLSGVLTGTLQIWGFSLPTPSIETIDRMEDWPIIASISNLENFINCPSEDPIRYESPTILARVRISVCNFLFGQSRQENSTARLWRLVPLGEEDETLNVDEAYWGHLAPGRTLQVPSNSNAADV